jgi:CTP:molybdopterin cytidylyltransferase MocA
MCQGVMVLLADQPSITSEDLKALVSVWQVHPRSMAAAEYEDVVGAPAIFPRRSFRGLASLRGDTGAQHLLLGEAERLLRVPMPNAAVDVDRPEDLPYYEHAGSSQADQTLVERADGTPSLARSGDAQTTR